MIIKNKPKKETDTKNNRDNFQLYLDKICNDDKKKDQVNNVSKNFLGNYIGGLNKGNFQRQQTINFQRQLTKEHCKKENCKKKLGNSL